MWTPIRFVSFLFLTHPLLAMAIDIGSSAPLATLPKVIQAKHEIGFVCLNEVQNAECSEPFKTYDSNGEPHSSSQPPPKWALRQNGYPATLQDWEKLRYSMIGYETFGFLITGQNKDRLILGTGPSALSVPQNKVNQFYPLESLNFCNFKNEKWLSELYEADLKTKAKVDLTKVNEAFKGIDPIGVLEIRKNQYNEICNDRGCAPAKIILDPKDAMAVTSKHSVSQLNLGFEHFVGVGEFQPERIDHLLVYDLKDKYKFQLQSDVGRKPKVWIEIPAELSSKIRLLPLTNNKSKEVIAKTTSGLQSEQFLKAPPVMALESKWNEGQFWIKIKIPYIGACSAPEETNKALGEFWIKYSENIETCPKGC